MEMIHPHCTGGFVSVTTQFSNLRSINDEKNDDADMESSRRIVFSVARWRRGAARLTADELLEADELIVDGAAPESQPAPKLDSEYDHGKLQEAIRAYRVVFDEVDLDRACKHRGVASSGFRHAAKQRAVRHRWHRCRQCLRRLHHYRRAGQQGQL